MLSPWHVFTTPLYVEMNPVAAGLFAHPGEYRWNSASAHIGGVDDQLVTLKSLAELISDRGSFLVLLV